MSERSLLQTSLVNLSRASPHSTLSSRELLPRLSLISLMGYRRANKQRSVGATNLNNQSSRSHAILTIEVTMPDEAAGRGMCLYL
jgi:hypothetical protein